MRRLPRAFARRDGSRIVRGRTHAQVNRALEREDYARFVGDYYDNYLARFKDFGLESPTTEGATSPAPAPARGLDARAPEFKYPARVAADAAVGWTAEDEARFDEVRVVGCCTNE